MLHLGSERSKGDYCTPLQLQRPVVLNGTRASKGISLCPLKGDSVRPGCTRVLVPPPPDCVPI